MSSSFDAARDSFKQINVIIGTVRTASQPVPPRRRRVLFVPARTHL